MNLFDPFGRIANRREQEYAAHCKVLARIPVTTPDAAREQLATIRKRAVTSIGVVALLALAVGTLWPDLAVAVLVFSWIALLWLAMTAKKAYRYTQRFIAELESARSGP